MEEPKNKCLDPPISNYLILNQNCLLCDISCNGCSNSKKNCEECANGYFKVDGDSLVNHCYLPEEIIYLFGKNYYYDNSERKYKKCHDSCFKCSGSLQNNCLECFKDYFLIEGECKLSSDIMTTNQNYFLPLGGNTFLQCDSTCLTCNYSSTYCTSCRNGESIFEETHECLASKSIFRYKLWMTTP